MISLYLSQVTWPCCHACTVFMFGFSQQLFIHPCNTPATSDRHEESQRDRLPGWYHDFRAQACCHFCLKHWRLPQSFILGIPSHLTIIFPHSKLFPRDCKAQCSALLWQGPLLQGHTAAHSQVSDGGPYTLLSALLATGWAPSSCAHEGSQPHLPAWEGDGSKVWGHYQLIRCMVDMSWMS